jgi:anti-sigma regulatory factor (Ser/Thr protein kinase)
MITTVAAFRHETVPYQGKRGFLQATQGFVREGLAAAEPVLVAAHPARIKPLREALGADADQVTFVDLTEAGRNPALIIPLFRQLVDSHQGRPVRGVVEPIWPGRSPAEVDEALLHETLLSLAFDDGSPLRLRCTYDAGALCPEVITALERRHPGDGDEFDALAEFGAALPEPPGDAAVVTYERMSEVRRLRALAGERAAALGIGAERAADLALAVHELAANSLRHGGGHGVARMWAQDGVLVCEVSDRGHITQPLVGRIKPEPTQLSGRGVWLANQLCDLVQIRSSPSGTVVRMHMARSHLSR